MGLASSYSEKKSNKHCMRVSDLQKKTSVILPSFCISYLMEAGNKI